MPSTMAILDAQVRQLASNRDNMSGSQATDTPPMPRVGSESSQTAGGEGAEGHTTSLASLLDMVLSSPVEQGRPANPSTSSLVSLGEGLPLIPRKMVEKIQAGDYVDFSDMPPAKGKARSLPPHWEGHILVVQLEDLEGSKRLIQDFQTWVQCFSMYAAVVVARHPDKFMPLMAYLTDMAKNARKYKWPSWVVYDQNFRMHMATTAGANWASVNSAIYTQCFLNQEITRAEPWCKICHAVDHVSTSCPSAPRPAKRRKIPDTQSTGKEICRNFNSKGCSFVGCKYAHKCSRCKGPHPATGCTSLPTGSSQLH